MSKKFDYSEYQTKLPSNAFNIRIKDNSLVWEMPAPREDDATHFILEFDGTEETAGWQAGNFPAGGEYYKNIYDINDFEEAINDWDYDVQKWNE